MRPQRSRVTPRRAVDELTLSRAEAKLLREALALSVTQVRRERVRALPEAPVFTPTLDEWRDPVAYLRAISPAVRSWGIAKIIPPAGWNPPPGVTQAHASRKFGTRVQALHRLQVRRGGAGRGAKVAGGAGAPPRARFAAPPPSLRRTRRAPGRRGRAPRP